MTEDTEFPIHENRVWSDEHWNARVVKNGRDKKNPKPLDTNAFNTLVKTAKEVIRRSEQQRHAELNKNVTVTVGGRRVRVALAIVPDEEGATATLRATDEFDETLAVVSVPPTFKLTVSSAEAWLASDFEKPR